jgi:sulfatase-like protein
VAAARQVPVRVMVTAVEALAFLLVVLTVGVGLGPAGWLAGVAFGVVGYAVLIEALRGSETGTFGPGDYLTLGRAVLVGAVTALVVDTTDPKPDPTAMIAVLAAVVLGSVLIDARGARHTTAFGARFAREVHALLTVVLAAFVATSLGGWVLAIGLLYYAFAGVGAIISTFLPWLREPPPPTRVRGVVAAITAVVLTVDAAGVLPRSMAVVATVAALALLTASFARDVWWLHRHRASTPSPEASTADEETDDEPSDEPSAGGRRPVRRIAAAILTGLAGAFVLDALVGPNQLGQLTLGAFTRIPVEGLVIAAVLLVLPTRSRRVVAILAGACLGLMAVVKVVDMGFFEVFDRPFHPIFDWAFLGPAVDFVEVSVGHLGTVIAVIGAILLILAALVLMILAVLRLTRLATGHRTGAIRTIAVLGVAWLVCALSGVAFAPGQPVASRSGADFAFEEGKQVREGILDEQKFADAAARDAYRYTPGQRLLSGLRGKDVLITFVESYGRVAIQNSTGAARIDPILDAGTKRLRAAGFDSRSAFLTSPTYGGGSWLAHAALQSGLWVNNEQRYNTLTGLDRMTLSVAFKRAGWRTVGVVPANTKPWPEGDFYHYDKVYDTRNLGYHGPRFAYATMPDQYILSTFDRTERAPGHQPLMAELDLVSSHTPFAPVPRFIDWNEVGDGSIYDPMPKQGKKPGQVWPDPTRVRAAYTDSIQYSLTTLLSYVETHGDDNLVLVFLGDHQPAPIISAQDGSRNVPISIVARDPAVLDRISNWGWQPGLNPNPKAPVMRMDKFRDRFLAAFGPPGRPTHAASPHR